jgi:hypothetical protein
LCTTSCESQILVFEPCNSSAEQLPIATSTAEGEGGNTRQMGGGGGASAGKGGEDINSKRGGGDDSSDGERVATTGNCKRATVGKRRGQEQRNGKEGMV